MVMEAVLALRSAGIVMEAVWLSRDDGIIDFADRGSRDYHPDDVSLDFDSMAKIYEKFGSFSVDTFATASNKKGDRFFSRLDVPGSAGCNFFHQRWESLRLCFHLKILLFTASTRQTRTFASRLLASSQGPSGTLKDVF